MPPTPTPFPIPLPIEFDPSITDWLAVLVAFFGAVATIIIGLLAYRVSRQATQIQEKMREDGVAAATAQARAANAQVEATTILAEVLNRNDEVMDDLRALLAGGAVSVTNNTTVRGDIAQLSELAAPRPLVNWNVNRGSGSRWELRNVGTATAFGVSIRTDSEAEENEINTFFEDGQVIDISPGSTYPFLWGRTFGSPAALIVVVSWHEEGDRPFSTRVVVA